MEKTKTMGASTSSAASSATDAAASAAADATYEGDGGVSRASGLTAWCESSRV